MNKNERLDKEVQGLLNTIRQLERENSSLRENMTKYDAVMVSRWVFLSITLEQR